VSSRLGDREIETLPPAEAAFAATVDVEDWFHTNYRSAPALDPGHLPRRVEASMDRVLEAFASAGVRGTFFVLGCVARDHPRLVPRIAAAGHEIACHGMTHTLVYEQEPGPSRRACARLACCWRTSRGEGSWASAPRPGR